LKWVIQVELTTDHLALALPATHVNISHKGTEMNTDNYVGTGLWSLSLSKGVGLFLNQD
jgi:hypothetical protein